MKFSFLIPVTLSILAIFCGIGLMVQAYRAKFIARKRRFTLGLSFITVAFVVFLMWEMTKDSVGIENFAFEYGDFLHTVLVTLITVCRIFAPFVFGAVGSGLLLNSLIHEKKFE